MWYDKVNQVILELDRMIEMQAYGKPVDMQNWRTLLQLAVDEDDNDLDDAYEGGFHDGMEWMREAMKKDD